VLGAPGLPQLAARLVQTCVKVFAVEVGNGDADQALGEFFALGAEEHHGRGEASFPQSGLVGRGGGFAREALQVAGPVAHIDLDGEHLALTPHGQQVVVAHQIAERAACEGGHDHQRLAPAGGALRGSPQRGGAGQGRMAGERKGFRGGGCGGGLEGRHGGVVRGWVYRVPGTVSDDTAPPKFRQALG
jgi:hypothetical protein